MQLSFRLKTDDVHNPPFNYVALGTAHPSCRKRELPTLMRVGNFIARMDIVWYMPHI